MTQDQLCMVTYIYRDTQDEFWLDIEFEGELYAQIGPFSSEIERNRAYNDITQMLQETGAFDVPLRIN